MRDGWPSSRLTIWLKPGEKQSCFDCVISYMHHFLLWVALFPTSNRLISDFDDQTGTGKPVFSFFTKTVFRGSPGSAVKPHKCVIPTSDDLDVYVSAVEEGVLSLTPTPILSDLINRSHLGGPDWPMSQSLFYSCAKWMLVGRSSLNVVLFLNILLSTNCLNGRGKVYLNLTVGKKVLTDSVKGPVPGQDFMMCWTQLRHEESFVRDVHRSCSALWKKKKYVIDLL